MKTLFSYLAFGIFVITATINGAFIYSAYAAPEKIDAVYCVVTTDTPFAEDYCRIQHDLPRF